MKYEKINLESYVKPSKFLRIQEGENRVRFLTEGYLYRVMGKKTARGFVRHIVGDDKPIPDFLKDAEPKLTYGFVVYSHATSHFHVLETSPTLGDMIVKLLQEKPDEEFKTTDILIGRTGMGLDTKYAAKWATESTKLPEGVTKDNPEFQIMLKHFE